MTLQRAQLLEEFVAVKKGDEAAVELLKSACYGLPKDFVFDKALLFEFFDSLSSVKSINDVTRRNEAICAYQNLFNMFGDPGEAVVHFFDFCADNENGPFDVVNFDIQRYILELELFIGNNRDPSVDQCKEPSKLFAWALIGDSKRCLTHFFNFAMTLNSVSFFRNMFEHLAPVCSYVASYKMLKGSLILAAVCDLVKKYSNFPQNLDSISFILLTMTLPRKNTQLVLISPELLYDEICIHLTKLEMVLFWINVLTEMTKRRQRFRINWDSNSKNLRNPVYLIVLLLKLFGNKHIDLAYYEDLFKNLGEMFKAHGVKFNDSLSALKGCIELDWATTFTILDYLQIPSTSYQRQIPNALYLILTEKSKKKYIGLDDATPSFENYLMGVFELLITSGNVPDEFIENGLRLRQHYDVGNMMAICFYRAYKNVSFVRVYEIKDTTLKVIEKLFKMFDCQINVGTNYCTPTLYDAMMKIQSSLIIGKAALSGIINTELLSTTFRSPPTDYNKLGAADLKLISTYGALARRFYSPYRTEIRSALEKRNLPHLSFKPAIVSGIYCSFAKLTKNIINNLENPPEEMKYLSDDLMKLYGDYISYMKRIYPNADIEGLLSTLSSASGVEAVAATEEPPMEKSAEEDSPSTSSSFSAAEEEEADSEEEDKE